MGEGGVKTTSFMDGPISYACFSKLALLLQTFDWKKLLDAVVNPVTQDEIVFPKKM